MKRCPECRRDYYDDTLLYCLDDGNALLEGPATGKSEPPASAGGQFDEPQTAILHSTATPGEAATRAQINTTDQTAILNTGASAEPRVSLGESSEKRSFSAHRSAKPLLVVLGLAVIMLGGFFGYRYITQAKQIESIAVMPFLNDSENSDMEYLSDGMTESLINSLSQIPNLSVKARSSVFRYKGKEPDLKTVAAELNVQAVLTGHIVKRGELMTLSLELIDARTENTIWGERYERKSADIVFLQSEIARDVSRKLKSKLSPADDQKIAKSYTADPEAYQLYLKGRFYWNKHTGNDLKQAVDFFNQAIAKDPRYALAYVGLAQAYSDFPGFDVAPANESMPLAKAAASRALEIDDTLADAHTALGYYMLQYEFDLAGSEKEFRRAIELAPNSAEAHSGLAYRLMLVKRFDESIAEYGLAEALDPLALDQSLADALVYARRYDEAIPRYRLLLAKSPNSALLYGYLGWVYGAKGMYAEAVTEARKSVELNNAYFLKGYLGLWLAKAGNREEAQKILAELKTASIDGYVRPNTLAMVYIGLGDKEEGLNQLEKEVSSHGPLANRLGITPEFDDVRSEPRFKALLKRMGLPE